MFKVLESQRAHPKCNLCSGAMTYARSIALLVLYAAFVLIVLGADLWHIFTRRAGVPAHPCHAAWVVRSITPHRH